MAFEDVLKALKEKKNVRQLQRKVSHIRMPASRLRECCEQIEASNKDCPHLKVWKESSAKLSPKTMVTIDRKALEEALNVKPSSGTPK